MVLPELPAGFRFHPTDQELVVFYLQRRAAGQPCLVPIIAEVDIYKFDPWDLPAMATFGDREWYFFTARDRKYPNGLRPNRSAASGFWKATGTDKLIHAGHGDGDGDGQPPIGIKKALVFYVGRPPTGTKTPWIMHEYRLAAAGTSSGSSICVNEWVLCRIFTKINAPPSPPPPADIFTLEDLLATPPANSNIVYAPPPPAPAPASDVPTLWDFYYTDDSDMYSGMLLAIQEEEEEENGDDEDNQHSGEAISEAIFSDAEAMTASSAACSGTEDQGAIASAAMPAISDQQIHSMLMDQAFFDTHNQNQN